MSHDFKDLMIWKEARQFRNKIFILVDHFPPTEKYRLKDQILRSSRSITANIAEGHGRYHYKENIQYCRQARGSLEETIDQLFCAIDCNYLNHEQCAILFEQHLKLRKLINGYIRFLSGQVNRNKD